MFLTRFELPEFDSFLQINLLIFTQNNKQCCEKRNPENNSTKSNKKEICLFCFFSLMNQTIDVKTPRDSVTLKAYKSGSSSSSRLRLLTASAEACGKQK